MVDHVVVGVHAHGVGIRYRRHRLTARLAAHASTASVTWLCRNTWTWRSWPTAGPDAAVRALLGRPRRVAPGVRELAIEGRSLPTRWRLRALRRARHRVIWYTLPALPAALDLDPGDRVVYDCSDLWSEGWFTRDPAVKKRFLDAERAIVDRADLVFASSVFLAEHLASAFGRDDVRVVENGVDLELFADGRAGAELEHLGRPRLGFVGGLKPRKIDFELLEALALRRPDWQLVLIGPREANAALGSLLGRSNVTHVDAVPVERVPGLLRQLDVGLLPYGAIPYNRGVFPLKLWEYAAAGLPSVGVGLPSTVHLAEPGHYWHVAGLDGFEEACSEALASELDPALRIERARAARWDRKLDGMIGEAVTR